VLPAAIDGTEPKAPDAAFLRQFQRYLGEIRTSIDPRLDDFSEFIAIVLIKKVAAILENL